MSSLRYSRRWLFVCFHLSLICAITVELLLISATSPAFLPGGMKGEGTSIFNGSAVLPVQAFKSSWEDDLTSLSPDGVCNRATPGVGFTRLNSAVLGNGGGFNTSVNVC